MTDTLPDNSTPLEQAVSFVNAERRPLDVSVIRDFWNPFACPIELLPYLAACLSVDLWDDEWTETKKRSVIDRSIQLHRTKGTLGGISDHMAIMGVPLVIARVPPLKTFPDAARTKAEKEAYLAAFKQLRVYNFATRGMWTHGAYLAGGDRKAPLMFGAIYPTVTDAVTRLGRRATVYEPRTDEETPVVRLERTRVTQDGQAQTYEQYALEGQAKGFFLGSPLAGAFLVDHRAQDRVFSTNIQQNYSYEQDELNLTTTAPAQTPVDVRPRPVFERGVRVHGQAYGSDVFKPATFLTGVHLPASSARERIYEQIHLHDPERVPERRRSATFLGSARLGMPPYNAEIVGEIFRTRTNKEAGRYVAGFLNRTDKQPLAQAIAAIKSSKALRDTILFTAKTHRTATLGDRLVLGAEVGQWIRDV